MLRFCYRDYVILTFLSPILEVLLKSADRRVNGLTIRFFYFTSPEFILIRNQFDILCRVF